LDTPSYLH